MSLLQSQRRKAQDADAHDFALTVEPEGDVVTISVTGELDLATVPALRGALLGAIDRSVTRMVLDLRRVTFIDSVGVGAVLHAKRRIGASGAMVVVLAEDSYAQVIFEVVGADRVVPVVYDAAAARASVTHA